MEHLETWQMALGIGATVVMLLISFFASLGAILLALVGYFLRNFHNEYKADKVKIEVKEEKLDQRMQRMAETFTEKMQNLVDKIAEKINQLPKGSDGLSQVFLDQERSMGKRIDDQAQRIQNVYTRTEDLAKRVHDVENAISPLVIDRQLQKKKEAV